MIAPDEAKAMLRRTLIDQRRALAAEEPDAGERAARLIPDELLGRFPIIAGYRPFAGEIDPSPLMRRFEAAGARLALPVTPPRGEGTPLTFRAWRLNDPLVRGAFGVLEPEAQAEAVTPNLILTPLLAFDLAGGRLGLGQGHFDRTLADLRARRTVFALGLAYAAQELARIPTEPHDQRLDAILTEKAYRLAA